MESRSCASRHLRLRRRASVQDGVRRRETGLAGMCRTILFWLIFQRFDGEHEPHEFFQFAPAGAVQSVAVARVIVLGPVGRQFIAVAGLSLETEVERQPLLHQQHRPAVDDPHRSPLLVLELL